ncbi:hypothetical protein K9N68_19185 [Kovacikia minuta CCNUW1]|uniref:WD40 repeat domain-containing protein n=1 Tax=Kovacikia minuta TaxID=2931930 RepID=UPI001CCFA7FD|nr:hypothetical protein [Kovacikia minuta]UBF23874.1 hypothetical protein K9N68_19185 [Kovacikia minuta CCNUW1]
MKLLPYDTFTLQTPDPLSVVLQRMATQIEPEKPMRWQFSRNHLPYEGTLSEAGFQIHRIIHHRNSFLPMIRGRFESSSFGTSVFITMRLHPFVVAFLVFWYLAWYSFSLPVWLTGAMPNTLALQFVGLPIALLVAFWAAFWSEADRSRRDLAQMILGQANPTSPSNHFNQWFPNGILWGIFLIGFLIAFLQVTGTFRPSLSGESESLGAAASCSQPTNHSPACRFSLVHTLIGHPAASALAMSADGQILVSGGDDKAIKIWDLKTGQLRKTLQSDSGKIRAVAIAPNAKTIVTGSADHMVRIWDVTAKQSPRILVGHAEDVNLVEITPDGKTVVSGSYGAIKQWDLATGQLKATFPKVAKSETTFGPLTVIDDQAGQFNPLAINPTSKTALISDLKLVDLTTNEVKTIPTQHVENMFVDSFLSAHMSLDGKLAVLQFGNTFKKFETRLKVWDLTTGDVKATTSATFSRTIFSDVPLALSRDRIFGITQKQLKVWNLQTARLEAVLNTGWMSSLVVTPDGKTLVGLASSLDSDQVQIKVWKQP